MPDSKLLDETFPHLKEFFAFLNVLNKESDRGAALIAVAMIDDLLERTILAFLVESQISTDLLAGFNPPLGSFAARTSAAYSLGLISDHEYRQYNKLRKIRNEFAHNVHQSFEDKKVKDICTSLEQIPMGPPSQTGGPKGQYILASVSLIVALTNRPHYASERRLKYGDWTI